MARLADSHAGHRGDSRPVPGTVRHARAPLDRRAAARLLLAMLLGVLVLLPLAGPAAAGPGLRSGAARVAEAVDSPVTLLLFHGEGCPHCAAEQAWLEGFAAANPGMRVELHEVWHDEDNRALLKRYATELGFEPTGVPVTIVGDRVWIGFSEGIAAEIGAAVAAALAAAGHSDESASAGPEGVPQSTPDPSAPDPPASTDPATAASRSVELPLVGNIDLAGSSLLISTVLIGFADGINPCSLWVLAVLLAIVLHSGSRGRVAMVGATFLLVTAGMYALYIVGMYSALDYVGQLVWIRVAVAVIAGVFGVLQLKDGIAPGTGPSLSISPGQRPRIYRAMRAAARPEQGAAATLTGTAALAVGVSLLETPCTAGLPLLWTSMLADQGVGASAAIALFAVYMAVFLIDELLLFGVAVITMRARHLQADEGRALKIISGSLLLTLGAVMLVAPAAMATLSSSLLVFASAGLLAVITWSGSRRLHPPAVPAQQPPSRGHPAGTPRAPRPRR